MRKVMTVALSVAALAAFPNAVAAQVCNPYTQGAWVVKTPVPTNIARAWGVYFPGNGNFYAMGGRQSDAAGSDYVNPREFNPTTDTWAVKAAAYPNLQVCNMVGGVLTIGGQSVIVTVGGSAAGATTATADVRQYNPITDTLTVITTDPWPGNASGTVLPGGAAVVGNVLYVFGGFNINVGMTNQIWKFDPSLAAGSRWTLVPATLPAPRGYIPAAAVGGMIYLAGGSDFGGSPATLIDTNQSLRFDPVTNTVTAIAPIPRATGETHAVAHPFDNTIWVLGGGRTVPNPSTQVNVYNPATNTWSTGPAMNTARRNFAADMDPVGGRIFAAGGYNTTGTTLVALNDQFTCTVPATAVALVVDAAGNGVFQPNETVVVAPTWRNTGAAAITLTGALTNHTGPAGPTYTIPDGAADYGTLAVGATASCTTTGNCYSVANTAATRPATHWDSTAVETLTPSGTTKTWTLHIGNSFTDVPPSSPFFRFIETLLHHGITGGTTATQYGPSSLTSRDQMAVFVLRTFEPSLNPPACTTPMFGDVPASSPFCRWIEELSRRGVVAGCGGGNYCPSASVTREQMAVFVLRTFFPALSPPACVPGSELFGDVPAASPFCRWIEELANRGVVTGCGGGNYCPAAPVTREQMSVFLVVTLGVTLYGL